jgi:hypothetical protein
MPSAHGEDQLAPDASFDDRAECSRGNITPPTALRAPGVAVDNIMDTMIHMRTIGDHEQDTPHVLQSHVSTIKSDLHYVTVLT